MTEKTEKRQPVMNLGNLEQGAALGFAGNLGQLLDHVIESIRMWY